jgi:selenide, water dikinase
MHEKFDLLTTVESGGCSAKLPPAELDLLLRDLPMLRSERLLVGPETHDDASVWRINDETAIISTTDFFPPVCSDPYDFGQIAAANSFSDVYAMGGEPISALNILMFPSARIDLTVMKEILSGGADKAIEAGAVLSGGHTLDDYPPKYGLAVTGIVHPDRIITNDAARPGEVLILTKPLGTAVVIAGRRLGETGDESYQAAVQSMKQLNRDAACSMQRHGIRAATDITGFSLLGHALKLAKASCVRLVIDSRQLPMLPGVYDLLEAGCIPGASFRNLRYVESAVDFADSLDYNLKMLAADAQTSGGILMCCGADRADEVLAELRVSCPGARIIGETFEQRPGESLISLV